MIQALPNGLEYTYETLLCSTSSRYPTRLAEIKTLLGCLACALSPLSAVQLSEILAMKPGERFLDFEAVTTDPYDALETIAPFIVIDHGGGFVKLFHYSLVEYLSSESILQGPAKDFHVDIKSVSAWLTSICLQYLTFSIFDTPLVSSPQEAHLEYLDTTQSYTFYGYAASNWFKHMRVTGGLSNYQQRYKPYLDLFVDGADGPPCYARWQQYPFVEEGSYSPICFAIWADLTELVDHLLPMLSSVDCYFADGFTCLTVAARWNRAATARKLLGLGASIDKPESRRRLTPLHLSAEFACTEVFDLLLDSGANPHAVTHKGTTPLYRAARGGSIHILKRLKDHGCDVNSRTFDNWTPLMEAVERGHEEVVGLLLEWGADLHVCSDEGLAVLSLAKNLSCPTILQKIQCALGSSTASPGETMESGEEADLEPGETR